MDCFISSRSVLSDFKTDSRFLAACIQRGKRLSRDALRQNNPHAIRSRSSQLGSDEPLHEFDVEFIERPKRFAAARRLEPTIQAEAVETGAGCRDEDPVIAFERPVVCSAARFADEAISHPTP